jgi:WD40 repeat protein
VYRARFKEIVEMRLNRLLPCVLLVAACGDNSNGPAPGHIVDAAKHIDAPDIDAPMQVGHNGRVWAIGAPGADADGAVAYGFDDGVVTLPFDPTTKPPLQIPGGTSVLQPTSGSTTLVFDSNGDKIAFIGDKTNAGTFDLYVANKDGSNATMLVPGTGVLIQSVQLSPDGTMAAYTSSTVTASPFGAFDLFVVNTTGTPAPVKISPDRSTMGTATSLNVLSFTWSSDSKLVAFSGDLNVDKANEAFLVDVTAATPTAVSVLDFTTIAAGTGVSGGISFDANNHIYFSAKVGTATAQFQLFSADNVGANLTNPTFVPARTDTTAPDIGTVGVSPDGKTLVFGADAPVATAYDLYAVDLSAVTPAASKLTNVTAIATLSLHTSFTAPFWFSPDGKFVAEVANWAATVENLAKSRQEPFVTALDGSGTHRIIPVTGVCLPITTPPVAPSACDVSTIQWTKDSSSVYVLGDIVQNNDTAVFKADPTMTDQTATPAFNVTTGSGDFFQMVVR